MTLKKLALALPALLAFATIGEAAMINTIIGNFDIAFDGATGEITDFNRPNGGNLDTAESRTFSSLEIEVDGAVEATLMNPPDALYGDLKITGLGSELTAGALVSAAGGSGDPNAFGFDFFDTAGNLLRIGIDDIDYTVVQTGIPGLNFFNFFAEGKVLSQSLPNGIAYAEDVLISYTATDVMVMTGQNGVRTLVASGAMTITGNNIPEPTAGVLLALAGLGGLVRRR